MRLKDLHTLHVTGLEWHDKINGNHYFGTQICINLDASHKPQMTLKIPFQNGYDDQYLHSANHLLKKMFPKSFWAKKGWNIYHAARVYRFRLEAYKIKNCTKKRVKEVCN